MRGSREGTADERIHADPGGRHLFRSPRSSSFACLVLLVLIPFGRTTGLGSDSNPAVAEDGASEGEISSFPEGSDLEAILGSGRYQTSFPRSVPLERDEPGWPWLFSGPSNGLSTWLFLGLAAILLAFLFAHLTRELGERRLLAQGVAPDSPDEKGLELSIPLGDIDALAREGRFEAAVRELLHRVFRSLAERQSLVLRRAMTSREIVRSLELPPDGAAALAQLAHTVEHSFFGGGTVEETEFRRCRDLYVHLEETLRSPRPAASRST